MRLIRLIMLVSILFASTGLVSAAQKVIVYGDDDYPPYSYQEGGVGKGIYVDILSIAFSRMPDYDVTIKMIPWKRGLKYLKSGRIFALFPPYHAAVRESWMEFSTPILREEVVIFGKPELFNKRSAWPGDYLGLTVGLNRGFGTHSMGGDEFGDAVEEGVIKVEEAPNNHSNLLKLQGGRIDVYINDKYIDISPYRGIVIGGIAKVNYGHLGFTRMTEEYPYRSDFKQMFNQVITDMLRDGEIQAITERYLSVKSTDEK